MQRCDITRRSAAQRAQSNLFRHRRETIGTTETKKRVSDPLNEAAVFSSMVPPAKPSIKSGSVPTRRSAAKRAQSDLFRHRRETLGGRRGAGWPRGELPLPLPLSRPGQTTGNLNPCQRGRTAPPPHPEGSRRLCADCCREIGPSAAIHPSLCPVCEAKVTWATINWKRES